MSNAHKNFGRKTQGGKDHSEKPRRRWENNVRMNLKEIR
jgi:hypothetical protein